MKKFSERKGYKKVSDIIQKDGMSEELRNSLWNILDTHVWSHLGFTNTHPRQEKIRALTFDLWHNFFKLPVDQIPGPNPQKLRYIRQNYFEFEWYEVYDFIEFLDLHFRFDHFQQAINNVLERELSGFRLIEHIFVDIIDQQEIDMLEEAFKDDRFGGVTQHLRRALELWGTEITQTSEIP